MRLGENATLEDVQRYFQDDDFAYSVTGCRIVEAAQGHSVAVLELDPEKHYNAMGGVMGGAIFTLADYALAVASNYNEPPSVSVSHTIEFMSGAKGNKLIATCDADKSGRTLGFYTVMVTDETGRKVAKMTATCFRTQE